MPAVKKYKTLINNIGMITLSGKIDATTDDEINDTFDKLLDEKIQNLILDFTEVKYINSTGIATVMGIVKEVYDSGYKTHAIKLNEESKIMFEAIGLNKWIQYFDSFEDAISSF